MKRSFEQMIATARRTNGERDASDEANGFASPPQLPTNALIRTALSAIECGIRVNDWHAVAEAYVMLEPLGRMK
jgi:hypothetical protein